MSLGAPAGIHLAARHPERVRSLSLHSCWHARDDYMKSVVESWRTLASALPSVADVVIQAIFPGCFTPEMYVDRPEFVDTLVDFVRSRPAQPTDAFVAQIDAVVAHDASAALPQIRVPTLITFGARDLVCSTRFAERSRVASKEANSWSSTTFPTPVFTRIPPRSTRRHSSSCYVNARERGPRDVPRRDHSRRGSSDPGRT